MLEVSKLENNTLVIRPVLFSSALESRMSGEWPVSTETRAKHEFLKLSYASNIVHG